MQHHYRLPGGPSIVCHVLSPGASSARSDCVYWRPSGPVYVPVAGSYWAAAIGGGAGAGGAGPPVGGAPGGRCGGGLPGPTVVGGPFFFSASLGGTVLFSVFAPFTPP